MTLPTFSAKTKVGMSIVVAAVSFACGRYSVSRAEVKTEVKQNEQDTTKKDEQTHTQTKIVEVKTPDGTQTKTTVITQIKDVDTTERKNSATVTHTDSIPAKVGSVTIQALVGTRFIAPDGVPLYGVAVSKQFVGPVSVGAFGLNNGIAGVSIGVSF